MTLALQDQQEGYQSIGSHGEMLPDKPGHEMTGLGSYLGGMTTNPTSSANSSATPSATRSATLDPRDMFAKSVQLAGTTIAAVRPDQLHQPTPCDAMTVRDLLGHLLMALDRVAVVGHGVENPFARPDTFEPDNGDWVSAWSTFARDAEAAWKDPAALARPTMLPWAAESGDLALRSYVSEITTHTWDLATATAQQPAWDNDVVAMSLDVMRAILPAEGRQEMFEAIKATMLEELRGGPNPYAAAVPVDAGSPLIDQLVAHVGRRPS